ncbi:MAG: SCO family protein [Planctomycetaceae bacterium]|nr:SCO family protein [Planctomycetaceae bacterium]
MSTTNREVAAQPASSGMRPTWLVIGGLMWILVFGALFVAWEQRRDGDQNRPQRNVETVAVNSEPAAHQDDGGDDAPPAVTVTLPVSSADDGQVIDLSELMGQAKKPANDPPMWDPDGIEDFAFTNSDGRTITKADLLGHPWAICFVFTKCLGPCPTVTKQMRDLQERLRDYDIRLVTLTVDPARDTADVLASYARLNGADPEKWYFLTGDQAEIYGLIHRSFRMPVQEVTGPDRKEGFEVIHSTNVMLVDADGVVRAKFNAAKDVEMAQLRRELQALAHPVATSTPPDSSVSAPPVAIGRN